MVENLVQQLDALLEPETLTDFIEMLLANPAAKLGIVEQEVRQLRPLLDEVEFRHTRRLAFELVGPDAENLTQDVTGVVERERLVEVAGEQIAFDGLVGHVA